MSKQKSFVKTLLQFAVQGFETTKNKQLTDVQKYGKYAANLMAHSHDIPPHAREALGFTVRS